MLCASHCDVCRAWIAYSVICKAFTLNDFQITKHRWDQFMFRANNETMVRQSNSISFMHTQRSLFLRFCDTNWHFDFVIHWMKSNLFWSENSSNSLQSSNAGLCKPSINMRWMFEILGYVKFDRCCVYVMLSLQCFEIYWKQVQVNGWTLQIVAFVI